MSNGPAAVLRSRLAKDVRETWKVIPFPDVVYFQEGPGIRNWQYTEEGVPFVNIRCLVNGRLDVKSMSRISASEVEKKYRHFLLEPNDFVVSSSGTIGRLAEVREEDLPCMLNTSVIRMRPCSDSLDRGYLKQFLLSSLFQDQIGMWAAGSAQVNYGPTHLKEMFITLPPIEEQRAIAHILGTLDDKIELNRRMNETLEGIARAIFTSWFVHFDPVRAKADGRQPDGMDAETAALFPDSFVDSELGEIPSGWGATTFDELTGFVLGGDWGADSRSDTNSEPAYCIRGADIPDLQSAGLGKMPVRYLKEASLQKRSLTAGDLVIEISGGSPTQSTGRPVLISEQLLSRLNLPIVCSNFCRIVRPRDRSIFRYAYLQLRQLYDKGEFLQFENGTTGIKNLAYKLFSEIYNFVLPSQAVLNRFDSVVRPLFDRQQSNGQESQTLAEIRDTLLPKLLSGEIRVAEAESVVSSHV